MIQLQVRVNALLCLGELVQRLDKQAVIEVLGTLKRCTAVDHSAPTLMCTLGVASAIYKQVNTLTSQIQILVKKCCCRIFLLYGGIDLLGRWEMKY